MISKIIKGRGMQGVVAYAMDGDHRTIIGGNLAGRTPRQLSKEFGQFRKLRPSLDRAVAHLILSAAPEDPPLDGDAWNRIAEIFLDDLGYQSCPHVIFRHNDTGNDHIHITCLRIRPDGRTVPDSNDRFKAERSLARIEEQFGLRRVNLVKKKRHKPEQVPEVAPVLLSNASISTHPKEKEMESNHPPATASAAATPARPEPLNPGADLAQHAYALEHGATVATAWAGDNPSERKRREMKRVLRSAGYDDMIRSLLHPDVRNIFHHPRGSVIYLKSDERLNDDGDRLTAYRMDHTRAARAMVALACARGWTSIVFNGPQDFIVAAMTEAVAQGLPVHPRDPGQRLILEQIMTGSNGAMGTVAIPMAFVLQVEPPLPYEPTLDPRLMQPSPAAPAMPPSQINTNLASRLGLRRQQRALQEQPHHSGPKGP